MTPTLSVIVAGGSPSERGRFAQALERQTVPASQLEVLTTAPGLSPAEGWNEAARRAGAPLLVFTRGDFVPTADFAQTLLGLHRQSGPVVGIGAIAREPGRSELTRYAAGQWEADRHALFPAERVPLLSALGSPLAVGRDPFRAVGGFAEGLTWGEELELALRLAEQGAGLERTATAVGARPAFRHDADVLARAEADGRGSVALYGHLPPSLPHLELGRYTAAGRSAVRLRNRLLASGIGPRWLLPAGALLPGSTRRRWARFVVSYAYWRGVWRELPDSDTRRRLQHPPIVLMYHAIGDRSERPGCYIVSAARFEAQLRWLQRHGYHAVRLDEVLEHRRRFQLSPARAVVLTFDDGYEDNYRLALPLLRDRGMPATFFLVSGALGGTNAWDVEGELAGRPLLSPGQARGMQEAGMELGAHTRHHAPLSEIPEAALDDEIAGCRAELAQILGVQVPSFAYPYGKISSEARRAVKRAGFLGAVCSRSGFNDPAVQTYGLRRIEIRGTDSLAVFARAVRRGHRHRKTR